MVALYDEIMEYGREELNFRRLRNKIPLEVILCFFKAEKNAFLTTNFVPPGLDGDTVYSLVSACFYYAVRINSCLLYMHFIYFRLITLDNMLRLGKSLTASGVEQVNGTKTSVILFSMCSQNSW